MNTECSDVSGIPRVLFTSICRVCDCFCNDACDLVCDLVCGVVCYVIYDIVCGSV